MSYQGSNLWVINDEDKSISLLQGNSGDSIKGFHSNLHQCLSAFLLISIESMSSFTFLSFKFWHVIPMPNLLSSGFANLWFFSGFQGSSFFSGFLGGSSVSSSFSCGGSSSGSFFFSFLSGGSSSFFSGFSGNGSFFFSFLGSNLCSSWG